MKSKGAEIATAEATAVMRQRKLNFRNRGNTALTFVYRVIVPHKRQGIHPVQFLSFKGGHGGILHKHFIPVILHKGFPVGAVLIFILNGKGFCVIFFIGFQFIKIPLPLGFKMNFVFSLTQPDGSPYIADF